MAPWCSEPCPACTRETRHLFDLMTERPGFLRAVCAECGAELVLLDEVDAERPANPSHLEQ